MAEQEKERIKSYFLQDDDVLILSPGYMMINAHRKDAEQLIRDMMEHPELEDELYDRCEPNDYVQMVRLSTVTKLYSAGRHRNSVIISYRSKHSGELVEVEIPFFFISDKEEFLERLQGITGDLFICEERPASKIRAVWKPLKRLVICAVICGFASYLAYYMENTDEYSLRMRAKVYPFVVAIQKIGSFWIFLAAGIITLFFLIPFVRSLKIPSKEVTWTRKVESSAVGN